MPKQKTREDLLDRNRELEAETETLQDQVDSIADIIEGEEKDEDEGGSRASLRCRLAEGRSHRPGASVSVKVGAAAVGAPDLCLLRKRPIHAEGLPHLCKLAYGFSVPIDHPSTVASPAHTIRAFRATEPSPTCPSCNTEEAPRG